MFTNTFQYASSFPISIAILMDSYVMLCKLFHQVCFYYQQQSIRGRQRRVGTAKPQNKTANAQQVSNN